MRTFTTCTQAGEVIDAARDGTKRAVDVGADYTKAGVDNMATLASKVAVVDR